MRFLPILSLCWCESRAADLTKGTNKGGYRYKVRPGVEISFYPLRGSRCTEAFTFPMTDVAYVVQWIDKTDIIPCLSPPEANADALTQLATTMKITSSVQCANRRSAGIRLSCFVDGVGVSARTADLSGDPLVGDMPSRVSCDSADDVVLLECAQSISNYLAVKEVMFGASHSVPQSEPDETGPAVTTPSPAQSLPEPVEESPETTTAVVAPEAEPLVEDPLAAESPTVDQTGAVEDTGDDATRQLTTVTGHNQARYAFQVLDSGVVKFLPRVGEECQETYILDGYSTREKYNAVVNTDFTPCSPLNPSTQLNPDWIIIPKVDCSDPVRISISCYVSFARDQAGVEMSRRAILQASKSSQYLSNRIGCGIESQSEVNECAAIANNYKAIIGNIPA